MKILRIILLPVISVVFFSCRNTGSVNSGIEIPAGRFQLVDCVTYQKLIVTDPWQGSSSIRFNYYLFPENTIVPDSLLSENIIRVPLHKVICMSTTHIAMISALNASETIVGISGKNLVYNPELRKMIDEGKIKDVGYESNLDKELIVSINPDLLIAYGVNPASAGFMTKLEDMGIKVMFNADYLEQDPLKRAEWIKVFGALLGKNEMADSIYTTVCSNYKSLRDSVAKKTSFKPIVLLGGPWENAWYIAPSNTYITRLLYDAGGDYIFNDVKAENSIPYTVESVFMKAVNAGIWLNPGAATSLEEVYSYDYRLRNLPVCHSGSVFNCNKRLTPSGGNDYWESAVIRPDIVLRDMVSILHPELLPGYEMKFFRKLQ